MQSHPKLFHSYIRNKKIGCPAIDPLKLRNGNTVSDPGGLAEYLADTFSCIYTSSAPLLPAAHQVSDTRISLKFPSLARVKSALKNLDADSSMDPDGIHPLILKSCQDHLAYPLYLIFLKSLYTGHVPSAWKNSSIVLIFKKGLHTDPMNYRSVSLTSVCCKILERIIVEQLNQYLEENLILTDSQFGFRAGRSVKDQLLLTYDEITQCIDTGGTVDLVLLDFSKAFDRVSNPILITT